MKVGVQLPEIEYVARWPEIRTMAGVAEDVGLDSLWLGEHLLYRVDAGEARGPWECWTMLAALAAATERIAIGPLVSCTSFHNPAILAKQAATVDEISGGRLILGLGAGWNQVEYRAFGIPFDQRISRFEEAFTIVRTLLRDGHIDFAGRFYEARDCELLPRTRPGGPPLMIGSTGERMLSIAIPYVDSWNAWFTAFDNQPAGIPALRDRVDAACRTAGRDPSDVERSVALLVRMPKGRGRIQTGSDGRPMQPISGEPEELAASLRSFAAEGIGHVQLVLDPITAESVEALAPALELLDAG